MHSVVDSGEAKEDGSYGPWMVVSKRTYGRKGTTPGTGTDSTRKSTWQPPSHLPPRNPEWLNTLSSGPTGNPSEPRIDGGFHWKVTEKWAAKPNGSVGNSSSGLAHSSIEKVKANVNSSGQVRSKSPNQINQGFRKLASSVKGKKAIARGSPTKTKVSSADNPLAKIISANIISLSSDRDAPLNREKGGSSKAPFEFTAPSIVGQIFQEDSTPLASGSEASAQLAIQVSEFRDEDNEDSSGRILGAFVESEPRTSHDYGVESAGMLYNPCSKDGSAACMELEDASGMISSD